VRKSRTVREPRAPREAPTLDLTGFANAFRDAVREEVGGPLAEMMDRLSRVADDLSWKARPLEGMFVPDLAQLFELGVVTQEAVAAAVVPQPDPCAVIGCPNPRGELGYCREHLRQRQQMLESNRLHPEWVEGAAPHSVPKVIPPRGPRGERQPRRRREESAQAALPLEVTPRPATEPRMFVRRKKADAGTTVTPTEVTTASTAPGPEVVPTQDMHQQIASTLGRWANEFKSRR
jgi:hypothetical protein